MHLDAWMKFVFTVIALSLATIAWKPSKFGNELRTSWHVRRNRLQPLLRVHGGR
jgi:hypothetical protein